MHNEFQEIINCLDTEEPSTKELAERIGNLCLSKKGTEEAIKELVEKVADYEADVRTCENVPFCNLLLSFSYYHWGDLPQAAIYAEKAANQFNRCGNRWNRALSLWGQAAIYRDEHLDQAITEYKSALKLINAIVNDADRRGLHNKYKYSKNVAGRINDKLKELEERSTASNAAYQNASSKQKWARPYSWPTARIIYGVYDIGHASKVGKYILDDGQIGEMSIDEVNFDEMKHKVYNLREGDQITLVPGKDYRWLKVAGNSMNRANPIPIEPDNYVLADLGQKPQVGNIVIANLHNPPTPAERAGVIKKYTNDGLKSESTETIDNIPLTDVDIRGVIIAVAKRDG
ncbi:MAG: hypothetical protein FD146_1841 [Anaerolineaceae bacterium]|nr:MAG: hypothetical protein FD146_1841 [Anaerolineaceae bacterium]